MVVISSKTNFLYARLLFQEFLTIALTVTVNSDEIDAEGPSTHDNCFSHVVVCTGVNKCIGGHSVDIQCSRHVLCHVVPQIYHLEVVERKLQRSISHV